MLNSTRNDEKFVAIAVEEAEKSKLRAKLGCIAVINGKVVAKGFNHYRTFSKDGIIERTCSCHAEMDVLRKCLKQKKMKKIAIYVARISKNGDLVCSAPCKRCIDKMSLFHIKTITYIDMEGAVVKQNFEDYHTEYQTSGYNAIMKNRIKCI
jgi:deoxycytidylate deaminase|tara:strand:- start:337 stop:792 length:456 start_codon:yes stop_codon:yes gene_type:complete